MNAQWNPGVIRPAMVKTHLPFTRSSSKNYHRWDPEILRVQPLIVNNRIEERGQFLTPFELIGHSSEVKVFFITRYVTSMPMELSVPAFRQRRW